jgi:hypothetical protein
MTELYKISVSKFALDNKIPTGDPFWSTFNASFDNENLATDTLMQTVYDGKSITTWHHSHWRTGANYICGQYLGIDFDTETEQSSLAYLVKDKFILKYGAFVYTTMSHTPEKPRSRALFLLDAPIMQAVNYTMAASSLVWLFGATADRKCKDAVRFFYGSKGCQFEYINQVLPLEVLKKLIAQYQDTGAVEKRRSLRKDYAAPATQQEVADALKLIPPWQIEYDEWVSVLMAIHAEFGDAGYALAENWGDGKQGEIEHKWSSFKQLGNTAGAVTIATVFGLAKRFGWKKTPA